MEDGEGAYQAVGALFGKGAEDYDAARRVLIPCYDEFYGTARDLVTGALAANGSAIGVANPRLVDLGAGSGLLTAHLLAGRDDMSALLVDLSDDMLDRARRRFAGDSRIAFRVADYTLPDLIGAASVDAVVSALSIHHLSDSDKAAVYRQAHDWLKPGGIFVNADQVLGPTADLENQYRAQWLRQVRARGATEEMLDQALERMRADRMATLADQLGFLRDAGFVEFDCAYKNYSFAVLWGRKG